MDRVQWPGFAGNRAGTLLQSAARCTPGYAATCAGRFRRSGSRRHAAARYAPIGRAPTDRSGGVRPRAADWRDHPRRCPATAVRQWCESESHAPFHAIRHCCRRCGLRVTDQADRFLCRPGKRQPPRRKPPRFDHTGYRGNSCPRSSIPSEIHPNRSRSVHRAYPPAGRPSGSPATAPLSARPGAARIFSTAPPAFRTLRGRSACGS